MIFSELPVEQIKLSDLPFFHRHDLRYPLECKSLIRCGAVKRGGNEPYCYTQEKQCAGHICRVYAPQRTYETAEVVRDDGTVWRLWLPAFQEVVRLEVVE